jgi:diguanylate cyclase (GGDEF)-like protein
VTQLDTPGRLKARAMTAAGLGWSQASRWPKVLSGARVRMFFVTLAVLLAAASVYASVLILQRQSTLGKISGYNLAWTGVQTAQEVSRLQGAIGAFALAPGIPDRQPVEMWLDIVENRVSVLRTGEPGAFIRSHDELRGIADQLEATIQASRPLLDSMDDPAQLYKLLEGFQRLNSSMARLSSVAHAYGADLAVQDAQEIDLLKWQFLYLLLGLIACCASLAVIASWHNRLLLKSNADVQSLVKDLTSTGESLTVANLRVQEALAALTQKNESLQIRDAELFRQNQLFDAALNNMSQGLGMFDTGHRLIVCNRRFSEIFRLPPGAAKVGAYAGDLLKLAGASGGFGSAAAQAVWSKHQELAARSRASIFVEEDEDQRSLSISHQPLADGGWVATYEDVTEGRQAEARIRHLANHDALTGLPNRRQFNERLSEALGAGAHEVAVLFLDLDQFKNVNDTLGHQAGDELLRAAAARIRECVREGDLVARQGGDEFAVLVQDKVSLHEYVEPLAARIIQALAAPFDLLNYQASVGVSVGIATSGTQKVTADAILKYADMALYKAKAAGRGSYRVFEASMAAELQARMDMEADLRAALGRGELEVHYQPLFDLRRGQLSGFEALLRWRHPERGMVFPADFIPIAEETGLIMPIGEWVLRQVCADAATFPKGTKVAVNISPVQFAGSDLVDAVREALGQSGFSANCLELEITESALLQDTDAVVGTLRRLRALGTRIALDDFGTKYSSLTYLRKFPFDKIKIDQSFVRDMATREDCVAIVHSVARLATQLGMTATAEGVETSAQLNQVRDAGCTEAQGYFFGKAEPYDRLWHWFDGQTPRIVMNT